MFPIISVLLRPSIRADEMWNGRGLMHIKHRAARIYGVSPLKIDGVEWSDGNSRYRSPWMGQLMAKTSAEDCQIGKFLPTGSSLPSWFGLAARSDGRD